MRKEPAREVGNVGVGDDRHGEAGLRQEGVEVFVDEAVVAVDLGVFGNFVEEVVFARPVIVVVTEVVILTDDAVDEMDFSRCEEDRILRPFAVELHHSHAFAPVLGDAHDDLVKGDRVDSGPSLSADDVAGGVVLILE